MVSGIRSEFHILRPVMEAIDQHPDLRLKVIVTGTHLEPRFGATWKEVAAHFPLAAKIKSLPAGDSLGDRATGLGRQIAGLVPVLDRLKPDITCVLGDREESLAVAAVCAYTQRACAHISGGDRGFGTVDDSVRHAVSKLAHLHFPTTVENRRFIIGLGEEPWRIHAVGASGLDRLRQAPRISRRDLMARWGIDDQPFVIILQHPVSSEVAQARQQMTLTLQAVKESGLAAVVIGPNSDAGARAMLKAIESFGFPPHWIFRHNLSGDEWPNALRHAEALLGNSSAGLLEAPFFACPAINIGTRQTERRAGPNLIRVPHKKDAILKALKRVRQTAFRQHLKEKKHRHLYGDGKTGPRIARILARIPVDEKLLNKRHL